MTYLIGKKIIVKTNSNDICVYFEIDQHITYVTICTQYGHGLFCGCISYISQETKDT